MASGEQAAGSVSTSNFPMARRLKGLVSSLTRKQCRSLVRILVASLLLIIIALLPLGTWYTPRTATIVSFGLYLIPYLIVGHDVILKAGRNIASGNLFDENFLMTVATLGAFALVLFPQAEQHFAEGASVMLFYQVGEFFQAYAVGKSRKSIAEMMDIAPDHANVERDGALVEVDPEEVGVGDTIVVKPGERIPLDGIVIKGSSQLDTSALTGESAPRGIVEGDEVLSGCINLSGVLSIRTTRPFGESTVSRILELVESASERKSRTESVITRFARWYTPTVVAVAVLLSVLPPLIFGYPWADWIQRGLVFLVVSCPCAFVIAVPLSYFGGIGGASKAGILIKGSNYLEALARVDTMVFDKTGTLTNGSFGIVTVHPVGPVSSEDLVRYAAYAEAYSNHPIAKAVRDAHGQSLEEAIIEDVVETGGQGVSARVDGHSVRVGNDILMEQDGITDIPPCDVVGTVVHVAVDGRYLGYLVIADVVKEDAAQAIRDLHATGIKHTVMLTGDRSEVAHAVARDLDIDEVHAELLPQDKVGLLESLMANRRGRQGLAFIGDGINDAPVLTRADVGIAMGAMGSDAAIEAADIVLMNDRPSDIAKAVRVSRKTMRIVWQNILFALGIKFGVLILAAFGAANMWMAVFADVGVTCIAVLNAMRALGIREARG
jgi:Cd2+/Zn2+-exporting ATPase